MTYPLVLELAADGIAVTLICRVLGFSTQGFYRWKANPVTDRDWADAHLINAALEIHDGAPEFGYRLVADELPEHGITAGENRVQRLCSAQRIWSLHSKKRGLNRKAGPPVHDDLLAIPGGGRDFTADALNTKWLTDITEHRTGEGKLYLRDQGLPLQPHRRLLHRLADESQPRGLGPAQRDRPALTGRHDRSFGQGQSISFPGLRPHPGQQRAHRLDGPGRRVR
jgi:putative transposase